MARYKPCDYSQTQLVPVSLGDQLVPGTLEHTIHYVVEERLDLSLFDEGYSNDETGRRAYDPKILLKVVLFGYANPFFRYGYERLCADAAAAGADDQRCDHIARRHPAVSGDLTHRILLSNALRQ